MNSCIPAIAVALIVAIGFPASAAPAPPGALTYAVINTSRSSIMLSTSGGCGSYQRPMKPAASLYASCAAADGKSTIAAMTYPAKKPICAAHISRRDGVNYTTFDGTATCRERQSLNHIEITVAR